MIHLIECDSISASPLLKEKKKKRREVEKQPGPNRHKNHTRKKKESAFRNFTVEKGEAEHQFRMSSPWTPNKLPDYKI